MARKGETIYFKEVCWSGSRGQLSSTYELYKRVDEETFKRISERDDTGERMRDFGNYRLFLDLSSGDVYEHTNSVPEREWILKQFNDTVSVGANYEKLDVPLVNERWVKANAFDLVHMLLKHKTNSD